MSCFEDHHLPVGISWLERRIVNERTRRASPLTFSRQETQDTRSQTRLRRRRSALVRGAPRSCSHMRPSSGFDRVYAEKVWGKSGGGSGPGSSQLSTRRLSTALAVFVVSHGIDTFLDAACGAMEWMPVTLEVIDELREVNGLAKRPASPPLNYTGTDIVGALIERHEKTLRPGHPHWRFIHADMTDPGYPELVGAHDLVMARDVFFHLSSDKVLAALRNLKRTGSRWLLATHTPHLVQKNSDLPTSKPFGKELNEGGVRGLNLHTAPYNLPKSEWDITEHDYTDSGRRIRRTKKLSLWRLDMLSLPHIVQ